jgi:hypothetical protein
MDNRGKRTFRASLLALAAVGVGVLGSVHSAQAQTPFKFDPTGDGNASDTYTVQGLSFAPGNALAQSAVPLTVGKSFQVYFQTQLTGLTGPSAPNVVPGLNTTYQITEVATLNETVTSLTTDPATGTSTATFALNPGAGTNQIAIYYNPSVVFNVANGTGFAVGTKIATLTPTSYVGSTFTDNVTSGFVPFNQSGAGNGQGAQSVSGSGTTTLNNTVATANPLFFNPPGGFPAGTTSIFGAGLQAPPSSVSAALQFTNPITSATITPNIGAINGVTGPDLQLQVNGFTQSFTVVPEPASVTLMGLGVVGALVVVRRTRARVA